MHVRIAWLVVLALFGLQPGSAQVERGAPLPRKAVLGAQLVEASAEEAKSLSQPAGTKIGAVLPGLTAEKLQMKTGDVLVSLNGKQVGARQTVGGIVREWTGGAQIEAVVLRDGKRLTLKGPAAERPKQKEDGFKVVYDQVVANGRRVRVIATHPEGKGPFPTLFMIGGIGGYSMDGDWTSVPYGNILAPLSKGAYATVRIDKPGQGDSEGPPYTELLFNEELEAYVQALRLAKTFPFVDTKKIAIVGHSMGGTFGPLVAAREPVKGVAAIATLSKTWIEYMLENTRRQSLLAGADPADVDTEMQNLAAVCHFLFSEGLSVEELTKQKPEMAGKVRELTPDGKTFSGVGIPFFQQLAKHNVMAAWKASNAKALAMWGENDFVSGRSDHEFIAEAVNRWRPGDGEFKSIPRSDHGFNETESFKDSQAKWGQPGGKFNPNVIEMLKGWLDKTLG